jgi:disease resistance protein RPS2
MVKDIPNSQEVQSNQCLNGYCPKNCLSSYKLGKKIVVRLTEANDMLSKAGNMQIAIVQPPKPVDEMPCRETVGLDLMIQKVWNSLEDDKVGIIGLYGMGGAGKTTLMKRIQSELGKREHSFDLVLWAVVSKDCDINKTMTDISNRLGIDDGFWKRSSDDQRVAKIYEQLKEKKFLLMLDDLWVKLELERLGVPVPKETNNKSKVMFTTRSQDVCAKMQAQKKFKVECLSEKEAFDLFSKKVGEETLRCNTEIPKLALEMAKECRGLPLALITVGSAMAGVESIEAWLVAKNNLRSSSWIASDLEDKVFRILKFSYDKLPDKAHKSCFLYCALYPEDFELEVDELIDRWIAEGFIDKDGKSIYDMYDQGKAILEKLILSCLLEESIETRYRIYEMTNRIVKMHDVIRDMALWVSRDKDKNKDKIVVQGEAFSMPEMDSERLNVVERISIITATMDFKRNWNIPACPNLTTLCIRIKPLSIRAPGLSLNFQSIKRLRVFDLSSDYSDKLLSSEIGELINLEYINLSRTSIVRWPIEWKKLKKLRVFLMDDMPSDYGVVEFPSEVLESLEQLRVFRFSRITRTVDRGNFVQGEISLLEKLESLPKLEELCIHLTSNTSVQRLLQSTKLMACSRRLKLSYNYDDNFKQDTLELSTLLATMSKMKHLETIYIWMMHCIMDGSLVTDKWHLGKLHQVFIYFVHGSITHLTWLRYAPLLEQLVLFSCHSIEHVVKDDNEEVGSKSNNDNIFTNLKELRIHNLSKLVSIHKRALAFPSLKHIQVTSCPNLRKLPLNSSFASKNNLIAIQGERMWWNLYLEWDDDIIEHLLRPKFISI